eukprot:753022-Hanusia_phi.AAC.2
MRGSASLRGGTAWWRGSKQMRDMGGTRRCEGRGKAGKIDTGARMSDGVYRRNRGRGYPRR